MESIIKEIYYHIHESEIQPNAEKSECQIVYDKLFATLNDEQKKLFLQYEDLHFMEYGAEYERLFTQGFQMAVRLIGECLF